MNLNASYNVYRSFVLRWLRNWDWQAVDSEHHSVAIPPKNWIFVPLDLEVQEHLNPR